MFFLAVTNIKFTHPAVPGDVLVLRAASDRQFAALHRFNVEATAAELIASGSLTLALVRRDERGRANAAAKSCLRWTNRQPACQKDFAG